MSELVEKLSQGDHPVVFRSVQENGTAELGECIERDYVHILFTGTRGGTELGFELDRELSDLSAADFEKGEGKVHLVGALSLDYVKVRCVADLDLARLAGTGHLEIVKDSTAGDATEDSVN